MLHCCLAITSYRYHPHLVGAVEQVHLGPGGGPAAVHTCLGWALQGPTTLPEDHLVTSGYPSPEPKSDVKFFFLSCTAPGVDFYYTVERLWKMDVFPYQSEKVNTHSKQYKEALAWLDSQVTSF